MNSFNRKINFGILGCGLIASVHADAISNIDNATLVGVADNSLEFAKNFAQKRGVKAFNDYFEMLSSSDIDVVCICTPSCFHAQNAIDALNNGKHVVLEKPMALSTKDADLVIETSKKTGKLLTVISQLRFSEDVLRVKKLIEEGALGKITLCELNMRYYRSPDYYSSSPWKGTLKFDGGGALMNQGIHGVDLFEYMIGDIKNVNGVIKTLVHDIEVEDSAVAIVEFSNGALGTIMASSCAYPGFNRKITINGSDGYVILSENKIEKLVIKNTVCEENDLEKLSTSSDPSTVSYEYHKRQLQNLISAINGEEELLIDASEGKKAVKIIELIYQTSAKNSK